MSLQMHKGLKMILWTLEVFLVKNLSNFTKKVLCVPLKWMKQWEPRKNFKNAELL